MVPTKSANYLKVQSYEMSSCNGSLLTESYVLEESCTLANAKWTSNAAGATVEQFQDAGRTCSTPAAGMAPSYDGFGSCLGTYKAASCEDMTPMLFYIPIPTVLAIPVWAPPTRSSW